MGQSIRVVEMGQSVRALESGQSFLVYELGQSIWVIVPDQYIWVIALGQSKNYLSKKWTQFHIINNGKALFYSKRSNNSLVNIRRRPLGGRHHRCSWISIQFMTMTIDIVEKKMNLIVFEMPSWNVSLFSKWLCKDFMSAPLYPFSDNFLTITAGCLFNELCKSQVGWFYNYDQSLQT